MNDNVGMKLKFKSVLKLLFKKNDQIGKSNV